MAKLGMFEKVTDLQTGETYTPVSGRGGYVNVKSETSPVFPTTHRTPRGVTIDRYMYDTFEAPRHDNP